MERIEAQYDDDKEFSLDPAGYLLIRIHEGELEVGLIKAGDQPHQVQQIVAGKTALEVYMTVYKQKWDLRGDHMAYLGRELAKAEFCLARGQNYVQDEPL